MERTVAQDLVDSSAEPTWVGLSHVGGLAGRAHLYLIGLSPTLYRDGRMGVALPPQRAVGD